MSHATIITRKHGIDPARWYLQDGAPYALPRGFIDDGPPIEKKTAAQAGPLNGGEMEKPTSHSMNDVYSPLARTATPRGPADTERYCTVSEELVSCTSASMSIGPELDTAGNGNCQGGGC
jgi:hypothetical protein